MSMGDLISRETAVAILRAKADMLIGEVKDAGTFFNYCANMIEKLPAVDAEPVKHAEWTHLGGDEWRCTHCGEVIHTEGGMGKAHVQILSRVRRSNGRRRKMILAVFMFFAWPLMYLRVAGATWKPDLLVLTTAIVVAGALAGRKGGG